MLPQSPEDGSQISGYLGTGAAVLHQVTWLLKIINACCLTQGSAVKVLRVCETAVALNQKSMKSHSLYSVHELQGEAILARLLCMIMHTATANVDAPAAAGYHLS
jgi:hypothetical protein